MIRVVIADDHPLVREGLKKVVNDEMDIEVIGEASDGGELLRKLDSDLPDLVILDLTMPGKNGLDIIKDIKNRHEQLPILVLSIHPEDRFAIRVLKSGGSGYLTKSSISDELVKAIRRIVTERKKYISAGVAEQLAQEVNINSQRPRHENLSDREFQILRMIAAGNKVSEIASDLSLCLQTVHTYRSRIKDKMNLDSNVEMTRYAIQNNLID